MTLPWILDGRWLDGEKTSISRASRNVIQPYHKAGNSSSFVGTDSVALNYDMPCYVIKEHKFWTS